MTLGVLPLGLAVVGMPTRGVTQQAGAGATASQDSTARDSVKKAKAAECDRVAQAMGVMKVQALQAQPKDSAQPKGNAGQVTLPVGPNDLPADVTMQNGR